MLRLVVESARFEQCDCAKLARSSLAKSVGSIET